VDRRQKVARGAKNLVRAALVLCALVVTGCTSSRGGIRVPGHDRVYVAVFVDESARGEVGVMLAEAIQVEVFQRDPGRLAMTFDEGSLAIDGTVHALDERVLPTGEVEIAIRTTVLLVDKRGGRVGEIGPVESRATYRPGADAEKTESARHDAIARIVRTLAVHVTREIDARGRAPTA
jgi:hypothetical protein